MYSYAKNIRRGQFYGRSKAARQQAQTQRRWANYTNRPSRVPRVLTMRGNDAVRVKFKLEPATNSYLTSSSTALVAAAYSFRLSDCPGITSYTGAFDAYRIDKITAIITRVTPDVAPATAPAHSPMGTAIDYDDNNIPTSWNTFFEYGTSMLHTQTDGRAIIRTFRPKAIQGVSDSGFTLQPAGIKDEQTWINCAYTDIPHFGFKVAIRQATTTSANAYYFFFIYHVLFRNTR